MSLEAVMSERTPRERAAAVLGPAKLRQLEEAGLTVVDDSPVKAQEPVGEAVAWMVEHQAIEGGSVDRLIFESDDARETARRNVESMHRTGYIKAQAVPLYKGDSVWGFDEDDLEIKGMPDRRHPESEGAPDGC